jgi:hypothetical protein
MISMGGFCLLENVFQIQDGQHANAKKLRSKTPLKVQTS